MINSTQWLNKNQCSRKWRRGTRTTVQSRNLTKVPAQGTAKLRAANPDPSRDLPSIKFSYPKNNSTTRPHDTWLLTTDYVLFEKRPKPNNFVNSNLLSNNCSTKSWRKRQRWWHELRNVQRSHHHHYEAYMTSCRSRKSCHPIRCQIL